MRPTKVSQLSAYASPWLKAADLQGRAVTVTIDKVTVESIRQRDGSSEDKIVVAFLGKAKKLICNKTQALTLADFARTEEFERWQGLTVILEPAKTRNGQDTINVRRAPPRGNGAGPAPTPAQEDNPFDGEPVGAMPGPKVAGPLRDPRVAA